MMNHKEPSKKGVPKEVQEQNEAKAIALFIEGYSSQEVADQLDIGRATASRYRKKWNAVQEKQAVLHHPFLIDDVANLRLELSQNLSRENDQGP